MNLYANVNAQMQKVSQPWRALLEAAIVVGILAAIPYTRKYSLWGAALIAIVWTLKALSKSGGN